MMYEQSLLVKDAIRLWKILAITPEYSACKNTCFWSTMIHYKMCGVLVVLDVQTLHQVNNNKVLTLMDQFQRSTLPLNIYRMRHAMLCTAVLNPSAIYTVHGFLML